MIAKIVIVGKPALLSKSLTKNENKTKLDHQLMSLEKRERDTHSFFQTIFKRHHWIITD